MSKSRQFSRRQFLQTTGAIAGGVAAATVLGGAGRGTPAPAAGGFSVNIAADAAGNSPTAQWAVEHLKAALAKRGIDVRPQADFTIRIQQAPKSRILTPETFFLDPAASELTISYADLAGMTYGVTEIADRVLLAADPHAALRAPASSESPATAYRGIVRMFMCTQDKQWFYDRPGWQKYLDMLVTHRFNRINLSFGLSYDFSTNLTDVYTFFIYPFFLDVPGYKVRAIAKDGTPVSAEEQKKNLDTLKFISDEAARRGLKFTLGIWTQNYKWTNSPNATHTIEGLDPQTQPPYCRDGIKMLIDACPGITGLNLRTHGESGVPEGSYDLWKIIMSGMMGHKNADGTPRIIELDLHGKTMTQQMIDTAATTGMPLIISCKQWAEHWGLPYLPASIRESEMPKANGTGLMALSSGSRNFLRYGFGDLLRKDRNYKVIHRVWPGTQKVLLWGDPLYAAENGRIASFAGSDGIDYFEPLSFHGRGGSATNAAPEPDRSGYADSSLRAEYDFDKYEYTFRLWGRLAYNPNADKESWQRKLSSDLGPAAAKLEAALASASRILLLLTTAHDPAAASDQYWPEMYTNQSLYDPATSPYSEAPDPKVFGNISPLDPQIFSTINAYAEALLTNKPLAKISPLDVARQLDDWCAEGNRQRDGVSLVGWNYGTTPGPAPKPVQQAHIDTGIALGLGQFFAHKFRAAILWQIFNRTSHEPAKAAATDCYKKARDAWAKLAETAKAYNPLIFGGRNIRGHWSDRLPAIDRDLAGMAGRAAQAAQGGEWDKAKLDAIIQTVLNPVTVDRKQAPPPRPVVDATFKQGQPLTVSLANAAAYQSVRLCYRHLHQGERYTVVDMQKQGDAFSATIPAAYTNATFPLQYYFELNGVTLFPGFKENFTGTPYFISMPA